MRFSHLGGLEVCFCYLCIPFQSSLCWGTQRLRLPMGSWCYCCLPLNIKKDAGCIAMTIALGLISRTFAHLPLLWLFWVGTLLCMKWDAPLLMSSLSWCFTSLVYWLLLLSTFDHTHPVLPWLHPAFLCTHFSQYSCPSVKGIENEAGQWSDE